MDGWMDGWMGELLLVDPVFVLQCRKYKVVQLKHLRE